MRTVVCLASLAVAGVCTTAVAQAPSHQQVVENAVKALKGVNTVSYHIRLSGGGVIADQAPAIEGDIVIRSAPGREIPLFFAGEGEIVYPGGEQRTRFKSAFDGDRAHALDFDELKVLRGDIGSGGFDLLSGSVEMVVEAFVVENPMEQELVAASTSLEEDTEVDGEACSVVLFQYAEDGSAGVSRWFFSKRDFLPRRIVRVFETPGGDATITYDISDLSVNPELPADAFALRVPEGYEEHEYDSSGLLPVDSQAPAFTLKNPEGEDVSLSDYEGKLVVLDFWATWCGPCKVAMPGLQRLHEQYKDRGVVIVGVNVWENGGPQGAIDYKKENGYTYGLLLEGDAVADAYRVSAIPTFYVIGGDGKIVYRVIGAASEDRLAEVIENYLEEQGM